MRWLDRVRGSTRVRSPQDCTSTERRPTVPTAQGRETVVPQIKPPEFQEAVGVVPFRAFTAGERIADTFEIKRLLGEVGMGSVYLAHHGSWDLDVALKVPKADFLREHPEHAHRITREAQAWTDLGLHPHVAYCYYIQPFEDIPLLVVEYLDGGNLRQWIEDGRCSDLKIGLDLAIQMCHGLEHAHLSEVAKEHVETQQLRVAAQDGRPSGIATGGCLRTFGGYRPSGAPGTGSFVAVYLSGNERFALCAGSWGEFEVWDVPTGRRMRAFRAGPSRLVGGLTAACVGEDFRVVLAGGADGTLQLWEIEQERCLQDFIGHKAAITAVYLHERIALSGSSDGMLRLWDVATGRCLQSLENHGGWINSVSLSADARLALSSSADGTLKVWWLDWELERVEVADWDDRARPYVQRFLASHQPLAGSLSFDRVPTENELTNALSRSGRPVWSDDDFRDLLFTLGCAGYGWLRPEGVRRELEQTASEMGRGAA